MPRTSATSAGSASIPCSSIGGGHILLARHGGPGEVEPLEQPVHDRSPQERADARLRRRRARREVATGARPQRALQVEAVPAAPVRLEAE